MFLERPYLFFELLLGGLLEPRQKSRSSALMGECTQQHVLKAAEGPGPDQEERQLAKVRVAVKEVFLVPTAPKPNPFDTAVCLLNPLNNESSTGPGLKKCSLSLGQQGYIRFFRLRGPYTLKPPTSRLLGLQVK